MKEGKLLITFIIAAISGVLAIHCGVHMFNAFHEPYHTTLVYAYTAYDSVEADGFLVRDEVVLPNQSGIVELTRDEGEKVGIGQTVALIHRDTQAQADQAQIRALTQEIKLLEYAMNRSRRADSVGSLDEDILREKRTVVLNLESTNKDIARRLLDFLSGVAYANEGKIKKVAISTYIITPYNVDILGDLIDELENNGLYF